MCACECAPRASQAPFRSLDMGSLVMLITKCKVAFKPEFCSPTLEAMLRGFLVVDADARLGSPVTMGGMRGIKNQPFFEALDWEALMRKEVAAPCALSEMFADDGTAPNGATTRMKRESRLQREFETWSGHDIEEEEEEMSMLQTHTPPPMGAPSAQETEAAVSVLAAAGYTQFERPLALRSMESRPESQASSTYNSRGGSPTAIGGAAVRPRARQSSGEVAAYDTSRTAALSLELTGKGAVWSVSHALVRALGFNHVGSAMLLGKSMLESASTLVEVRDLEKFTNAFEKAVDELDDRLAQQAESRPESRPATPNANLIMRVPSPDDGMGPSSGDGYDGSPEASSKPKLPEVTVWFATASGGRVCLQTTFEVVTFDKEGIYQGTGGPSGLVVLTMVDVTVAEHNKALVSRRYELAYNEKAPDESLIEFFASYVRESTRSVPVPGSKRRSPTPPKDEVEGGLSSGVRAYLERRRVLIDAFPDLHFTTLEQTTQGSSVYTSWQWTGTHLGPYPDAQYTIVEGKAMYPEEPPMLEPSGARVHVHGISIDAFENGRIVDHSVFYDEAAIRAQLELKAGSGSRGRDTRSILRRAHDSRSSREYPITVQLYLSVKKEHARGGVSVGAMMRPVISTAPRFSAAELTMMSTMETYYASKATAQIGSFVSDGFCLCDAGQPLGSPNGRTFEAAKRTPASIILYSRAFARIVNLPTNAVLRADLHALIEPLVRRSNPELAVRLAEALAKQEAFRAVFEAHTDHIVDVPTAPTDERGLDVPPTPATGDEATPPGRVVAIDIAPFVFERRLYWSVLLSDMSDDLVLCNVDLEGRRPPVGSEISISPGMHHGASPPSARGRPAAGSPGSHGKPAGILQRATPFKSPMKRASRTSNKLELADHFVHCVPSSWRWFGCKMLQNVMTAALHASNAALSLSDLRGEDAPLVWIAEGFSRINGWSRLEAIGRNCRFLQTDASDVAAVYEMRQAIAARVHTRVYLWNENISGVGFWSLLSLVPGRNDEEKGGAPAPVAEGADGEKNDTRARYMMGVQHRITRAEMRFIFEKTLAYRTHHWQLPETSDEAVPVSPVVTILPLASTAGSAPPVPSAAEPANTTDVASALGAWEAEHMRLHGRKPTKEEVTAMVLEVYAKSVASPAAPVEVA